MNALIDLILIFIFVYLITHVKIIDLSNMSLIKQKLMLTSLVLVFVTILNTLYNIYKYKQFNMYNAFVTGVVFAVLAFIGQTIYNDASLVAPTDKLIDEIESSLPIEVIFAGVTALSITIGRLSKYLFVVN